MRFENRGRFGHLMRGIALGLAAAAFAGACAKAQARSVPDGPPLDVPIPPARVLAPLEEPALAVAPPVDVPADAVPAASPPPAPVRPPQRRVEQERPAEPVPAPVVEGPVEPRDLRPTSPALDAAAERDVREILVRAARDLGRVDVRNLNAEGRQQYDQSRRFTQQAEQALRDRNFVFAATLADKAATLAAGLVGR